MLEAFVDTPCDIATHLPGYAHCSSDYTKRQSQRSQEVGGGLKARIMVATDMTGMQDLKNGLQR